mmetsp:Transcript_1913/g.4383  ORF Transcript_1913/g.4383 Transcript_1913/m.4383 type:complete len:96 (-) Transcript_1913:924-1211(-)
MPWARNEFEKLWTRIKKVCNLWNEEQEKSLAEMPKDCHNREGHSSKVAKCIANEDTGRIPVMISERKRRRYEWDHKHNSEHVILSPCRIGESREL